MPKFRQIAQYLERKNNKWMVCLNVPKDLQPKFGKARLKKSLKTTDLAVAEKLKGHFLQQWQLQFDLLRKNPDISALDLEEAVETFENIISRAELAGASFHQSFRETAIMLDPQGKSFDEQKRLAKIHSGATGYLKKTKTIEYIDEFLEHQRYSKRVEVEAAKYLKETFAVKFPVFELIDEQNLRDYCNGRLKGNDGEKKGKSLRPAWTRHTLIKYLNYIKCYWQYCHKQYDACPNLIDYDSILPLQSKKTMAAKMEKLLKNEQYSDEQCYHLLDGAITKGDDMLRDLIILGMYTGCRLEELCQLKVEDVYENGFDIKMAKTMAGIRIVPIHHEIQQLVERLIQTSEDGYLLSGLSSNNQIGVRSKGMSQKFSRLKQKLGYGKDKKYTFHSFRSSLCRRLENAGVDVIHAKRLVGHSEDSQTYGIYSRGTDWDIRVKEMNKAKYLRPASSSTG